MFYESNTNGSPIRQNVSSYLGCDIFDIPFSVKVTEILVLSVILLSSLVGNFLIITIVWKRPELRKTVNYFIVNVAVSDFIFVVISVPVRLAETETSSPQWHVSGTVGLVLCKLYNFVQLVSFAVSTQSLVWIGLDRFVAVVFPMKVHYISCRFRAFAIASTWTAAVSVRSIDLYLLHFVEEANSAVICMIKPDRTAMVNEDYLRVYTALFIVVPFIAVTILYCVIAANLRRQQKALPCSEVHQKTRRKQEAVKMSFCIMAAFYICALPLILQQIFFELRIAVSCSFIKVYMILGYLMFYLSSTINPIICLTFVGSYRRGFKEICCSCWSESKLHERNSRTEQNTEQVTLQEIRVIPEIRDNLAINEN